LRGLLRLNAAKIKTPTKRHITKTNAPASSANTALMMNKNKMKKTTASTQAIVAIILNSGLVTPFIIMGSRSILFGTKSAIVKQ